LINGAQDIEPELLIGCKKIGITAGASAPEVLLERVIDRLGEIANISVSTMDGVNENVKFKIPTELENVA
jgi:4-hydroxy-3-methylbut-2-enyl diphosphate reductase